MATSGFSLPRVTAYIDWKYAGTQYNFQVGSVVQDQESQPIYGLAEYGTAIWDNQRVSAIRADFSIPDCRYFRFQLSDDISEFDMQILGFSVMYEKTGVEQVWTSSFDFNTGEIRKFPGQVPDSYLPSTSGII